MPIMFRTRFRETVANSSPVAAAAANASPDALRNITTEHGVMLRHLAELQLRCSRVVQDQADEIFRLRSAALVRETALMWARQERDAASAAVDPGLPKRRALSAHVEQLRLRLAMLTSAKAVGGSGVYRQWAPESQKRVPLTAAAAVPAEKNQPDQHSTAAAAPAILCVGAGIAHKMFSEQVAHVTGGRLLQHDGAAGEDNARQLEASLAAADLVICQTGCLSHDAYWLVHDHCGRTGKRCVVIDPPETMHVVTLHRQSSF